LNRSQIVTGFQKHRDIKPANIMLIPTGRDTVKVMDFGIAHVEYSTLTQEGAVLGTPRDMSPEQIRGDKVDGPSDIFSLGVIVYEMVAGNRPSLGESRFAGPSPTAFSRRCPTGVADSGFQSQSANVTGVGCRAGAGCDQR
jgi:serine/threonine protein kinase